MSLGLQLAKVMLDTWLLETAESGNLCSSFMFSGQNYLADLHLI